MSADGLPLPVDELPTSVRRFGNPEAPAPARLMAAKGLVPVKGDDLVTLLVQLSSDPESSVKTTAQQTLSKVPEEVLLAACGSASTHPAILAQLALQFAERPNVLERLVQNPSLPEGALAKCAAECSEQLGEIIAANQERLLRAPVVIEALYKNAAVRMSTVDRLVELAARHGLELAGIPSFVSHAEAIKGQLLLAPGDEAAPEDLAFQSAVKSGEDDASAIDRDPVEGTEQVNPSFVPLHMQIRNMGLGQKLRLAVVGGAAARSLLVRDPNRSVAVAAISSPRMTDSEAAGVAHSKDVIEDVLRYIGNKREWLQSYEIKRALVFNPKTPVAVALRFIPHMRDNDLKTLARSRSVPGAVKTAATQRQNQKQRRG